MSALTHLPDHFITLPFRSGKEKIPDWQVCVRYISIHHSSNNTSAVEKTFVRMNQLHSVIVQTCRADSKVPPHESFIENTLKPYCELLAMAQAHLPLYSAKVHSKMMFTWKDSFDHNQKHESFSAYLELLSCIYNLAASHAFVASQQAQGGNADGVKNAFQGFQHAAGYYDMVEKLLSHLPPEQMKSDLTAESLGILRRMCLTMAHHCAYLTAENNPKVDHVMLSKMAQEGAKQYAETVNALKGTAWYAMKKSVAPQHEVLMTAASIIFFARAHLHLAVSNMESNAMGVAIGHFEKAQGHLAKLAKMPTSELRAWVSSIINNVNKAHQSAISANESVYFMRVSKDVENPAGLPRALGKATEHISFTSFEPKRGVDPFFGIVPAHIAATAAKWRKNQRERVDVCAKACASVRDMANEKMQSLGVTAAIEVLSGESKERGKLPVQLYERIQSLHVGADGSSTNVVDSLLSLVEACHSIWRATTDKVEQIKSELAAEKKDDESYMEAYGERMWRAIHLPASQLGEFHAIQSAINEHEKGIQMWLAEPFSKTKSLLENSVRDIARLDWSKNDLDALMPIVETREASERSQKLMAQAEVLKKLSHKKDTIQEAMSVCLKELSVLIESDAVVFNLSSLEESRQGTVLDKASQEVADAIEKVNHCKRDLEEVMVTIDEAMRQLGCLKSLDPVMEEVQKVCNALENACHISTNLRQEFGDIMRYGSAVLDALEVTFSTVKSFVLSRKLEAEELKMNMDDQIAQKVEEMRQRQDNTHALESQQHCEQIRQSLAFVEQQQEQRGPDRLDRMDEIMRRQREVAAVFGSGPTVCDDGTYPPPPATMGNSLGPPPPASMGNSLGPPPPASMGNSLDPPPPSYDSVISGQHQYKPL